MKTKTRLEAEPAYENQHLIARDMLDRISELLSDMPAPGCGKIDWSHVGTMQRVTSLLNEVIESCS